MRTHTMDRRRWQIDYLERTRALHATTLSGPNRLPGGRKAMEREAGESSATYRQRLVERRAKVAKSVQAAKATLRNGEAELRDIDNRLYSILDPELETTVGLLERTSLRDTRIAARILLETDFLYLDKFIRAVANRRQSHDERVDLYGRLRGAVIGADDTLWESWVKRCFPGMKRLPTGTPTWRELVRRIVRLVGTTRIHARGQNLSYEQSLRTKLGHYWMPEESKDLNRVGNWQDFALRAENAAVKCDDLFGRDYSNEEERDHVGITDTEFYLQIDSEKYRKQCQRAANGMGGRVVVFPDGSRLEGFSVTVFRGSAFSEQGASGWINPRQFVCNELFDAIALDRDNQSFFPGGYPVSAANILEQLLFPRWS